MAGRPGSCRSQRDNMQDGRPEMRGEDAHQHLFISAGNCHCHLPVGAEAAWPANG